MQTDALFYELFQAAPQTFFELLQIEPRCPYRFESLTVKTSEKRIDGVLEPEASDQPIYFVEVQAFPDAAIYWRTVREVTTFFEQRADKRSQPWQAIVLWLNREDDPGFGTLAAFAAASVNQLVAADLLRLLTQLGETALAFNVLRPLLAVSESEVRQNVIKWAAAIQQSAADEPQLEERLITVMSQFIEQKFKTLTYKELSHMLRLTPLAETTSVREVIKDDRVEALIEQIQEKFSPSSETLDTLKSDLQALEMDSLKLLRRQIFHIATVEQLETWIASQTPDLQN